MTLPLISIITPSFNQGHYIEQTICSVLNQDYPAFEHIIIDGGSQDNTIKILKKYKHLIWISEPDNGQTDAINKGLKMAKGKIVAWLNSDDFYQPKIFPYIANMFINVKNLNMLYGACNFIYEYQNKTHIVKYFPGAFSLKKLLTKCYSYIPQPAVFLSKSIVEEVGYLNETLNYAMDHDLFIKIGKKPGKVIYVPRVFSNFRKHFDSKTVSLGLQMRLESFKISKKYIGFHPILLLNFAMSMIVYSNPLLIKILRKLRSKFEKEIYV